MNTLMNKALMQRFKAKYKIIFKKLKVILNFSNNLNFFTNRKRYFNQSTLKFKKLP